MRPEPAQDEGHELGVPPNPAVLDVEVHERAVHVREPDADERAVLVLALVHHEDPIGPQEEVPGERHGGERRDPCGADLEPRVAPIEVLRRPATVDIGGAYEEDALARCRVDGHQGSLYCRAGVHSVLS